MTTNICRTVTRLGSRLSHDTCAGREAVSLARTRRYEGATRPAVSQWRFWAFLVLFVGSLMLAAHIGMHR